ncbi:50S ribosomal protein L27 [Candidatus Gottesmanbacteria bacterium]|nr:50S ribosomal protein L27 [Candidatus Gottesmanbacteria bacterium]
MAHIKTGGTTKGNRDSKSKRLGVKVYAGTKVVAGNILVRQKGTRVHPGEGTKLGRDFTIYAVKSGIVQFKKRLNNTFVGVAAVA